MTWEDRISTLQKFMDLAVKYEVHAFVLIFTGAGLYLHGAQALGQGMVMTGLGVFKGNK